jgi:hypothetical protein
MSIEKKSLISTLKTTKKANVANVAKPESVSSKRMATPRMLRAKTARAARSLNRAVVE